MRSGGHFSAVGRLVRWDGGAGKSNDFVTYFPLRKGTIKGSQKVGTDVPDRVVERAGGQSTDLVGCRESEDHVAEVVAKFALNTIPEELPCLPDDGAVPKHVGERVHTLLAKEAAGWGRAVSPPQASLGATKVEGKGVHG